MKKIIKWGLIGLIALIVIAVIFGGGDSSKSTEDNIDSKTEQAVEVDENLTDEQKIEQVVNQILEGQNNLDQEYKKSLEIRKADNGQFDLDIGFNADDNLSNNMIKGSMESKMSEIYIALYTQFDNIKTVSIGASFPMRDKYGNESNPVVYYTELTKEEAGKVNWEADESSLKVSIIPSVWTTHILHPEFK